MNVFQSSQWIWLHKEKSADEYAEFTDSFSANRAATVRISCDGDYTLWINGKYAASGQYGDFEHYKVYDTVDISFLVKEGENRISVLVWHPGKATQRYRPAPAGLIYEITDGDTVLATSNTETKVRLSPVYQSGRKKKITGQLGFGFAYDATKEADNTPFAPAVAVEKNCIFYPRPIPKHSLAPLTEGKEIRREGNRILFDLGKECVGLLSLFFRSPADQNTLISFGEHLAEDGWAPRIIGGRDFSIEYRAKEGDNQYINYMLRFGCRFLELESEHPLSDVVLGIQDQIYPTKRKEATFANDLDARIYNLCVNTWEKCMMEHYVDCPWREQNLYAFDSRNQMLCGYKVFEGGNTAYARANLMLFANDRRDDGLLSICSPCGYDLTIPSFSLYFVVSSAEYLRETGDADYATAVLPKLTEIIDAFLNNRQGGLIMRFEGANHWNFYDWSEFSDGTLGKAQVAEADAAINLLLIYALNCMEEICNLAEKPFPYKGIADALKKATKDAFFVPEKGLFTMRKGAEEYTELANSLAVLTETVTQEEAKTICQKITEGKAVPCTLSMHVFKYDALLKTDRTAFLPYVLDEIRREYKIMLDSGYDCVWETTEGWHAFEDAGSLCHGWSAVPVLYLPQIQE